MKKDKQEITHTLSITKVWCIIKKDGKPVKGYRGPLVFGSRAGARELRFKTRKERVVRGELRVYSTQYEKPEK